jgi:hypothetical protein
MSDTTTSILGSEFATWANERVGDRCPLCQTEIEYTPLGMEDGQSTHRVACDCTVIESAPREDKEREE